MVYEEICPTCKRNFKLLVHYPFIRVNQFKRKELPSNLVLPFYDDKMFSGPKWVRGSLEEFKKTAPKEVLDYFEKNPTSKEYVVKGGFRWVRYNDEKQKSWKNATYRFEHPNEKDLILSHINPYFDALEKLVGKVVEPYQKIPKGIFPNFKWIYEGAINFHIPDTLDTYRFVISEKQEHNKNRTLVMLLKSSDTLFMFDNVIERPNEDYHPGEVITLGELVGEGRLTK